MQQQSRPSHNRSIFFIKTFYFLFFAAAASLFPILALFYEQLGLSGRQIGVLVAIPPLVTLFAASFWGGLADATQQHRRLLGLAIGGVMVFALVILFSTTFWALVVAVICYAFVGAPIMPLIDNSALESLGARKNQYGRLRLWGAVGWGLAAPVVGLLVEQFGLSWSFYGYVAFMLVGLMVSFKLPITRASIGREFWRGFHLLMGNRSWLIFLVIIFVVGIGSSLVHNYLFLYMHALGAGNTLMGLALSAATLSELAVFFYSDLLLERWGIRNMLALALSALSVRLLAYSLVPMPWLVLPIQLLHGFSFSVSWVAGVAYANRIAPPGMGATAQGIVSGVSMGLAAAVGGFTGGWLYESVGPFLMYRWAGIGLLLAMVFFMVIGRYWMVARPVPVK